jgi:hypothetical protein
VVIRSGEVADMVDRRHLERLWPPEAADASDDPSGSAGG